jgi:long-subunit fatty acid transport protein
VVSGAFGYEYHETREKDNGATVNDPLGTRASLSQGGGPVGTADGDYDTDIYLFGVSVGYRF